MPEMTVPPIIIPHPIPQGGEGHLHIFGNKESKNLVMMCAGFPDDHSAFTPLARRLATECGCLVGVACLPGYEADIDISKAPKDGYSLEEWVISLREAVKALRTFSTQPAKDTKLTAIFHDWGAVVGLQFANQTIEESSEDMAPNKLVVFDILPRLHPKTSNVPTVEDTKPSWLKALNGIRMLSYQAAFAGSFLCHKYLSSPTAASIYFSIFWPFLKIFQLFPSGPGDVPYLEKECACFADKSRMAYKSFVYSTVIGGIFSGKVKTLFRQCHAPLDLEKTPLLFMFGGGKKYMLHSPQVVAYLKQEEEAGRKSRAIEMKDAGHWFYLSKEEETFAAVKSFIAA